MTQDAARYVLDTLTVFACGAVGTRYFTHSHLARAGGVRRDTCEIEIGTSRAHSVAIGMRMVDASPEIISQRTYPEAPRKMLFSRVIVSSFPPARTAVSSRSAGRVRHSTPVLFDFVVRACRAGARGGAALALPCRCRPACRAGRDGRGSNSPRPTQAGARGPGKRRRAVRGGASASRGRRKLVRFFSGSPRAVPWRGRGPRQGPPATCCARCGLWPAGSTCATARAPPPGRRYRSWIYG
jgi:hypothetical protein